MNKTSRIIFVAAFVLAGFIHLSALAQQTTQTQADPATMITSSNRYIGAFYAYAKMTNASGYIISPPTNATSGTFQDVSGFPAPYSSSLIVTRKSDGYIWHTNNNNNLTFPVTNTTYTLTMYVNSTPPPPTNGQPMTLQVQWNTNSP